MLYVVGYEDDTRVEETIYHTLEDAQAAATDLTEDDSEGPGAVIYECIPRRRVYAVTNYVIEDVQ